MESEPTTGSMVEVRAVVRREMLDRVVQTLKDADCPRLLVTHLHAIGAGVDPATERFSLQEGSAYADKALVQLICDCECCEMYAELIARAARTGRKGDGFVSVHPIRQVINIRTGATGAAALQ